MRIDEENQWKRFRSNRLEKSILDMMEKEMNNNGFSKPFESKKEKNNTRMFRLEISVFPKESFSLDSQQIDG